MNKATGTGGRPTREESEQLSLRIIQVAHRLMLERGYAATSIEAIARAAGVAKRTLYDRFPDKRALFAAILQHRLELNLFPGLEQAASETRDIEQALKSIGSHLLAVALTEDAIAMRRLITAEAGRFPELQTVLYEQGFSRLAACIEEILMRGVKSGELAIEDTGFAAEQFIHMVHGPVQCQATHGVKSCAVNEQRAYMAKVVDLFLNGCRPTQRL
ncbi:TetR/AcrR family transcriptional regulator [Methyloterricola oryzae]|uniref:TetR/AcrR family transcriptional regulator n=1 Tax=Methyloterricola oryzae TaxID=1495050 RepID=UPI0005EBBD9B|nr:TetR/AcrR family transcriptional regulator [Methyloterricola oryzae]